MSADSSRLIDISSLDRPFALRSPLLPGLLPLSCAIHSSLAFFPCHAFRSLSVFFPLFGLRLCRTYFLFVSQLVVSHLFSSSLIPHLSIASFRSLSCVLSPSFSILRSLSLYLTRHPRAFFPSLSLVKKICYHTRVWTALRSALLRPTENANYRISRDDSWRERWKDSTLGIYLILRR